MDRITGYEPVDSGSNPDRRMDMLQQFGCYISNYIWAGVPSGEGGGL